jgi:hypothetical protein
MEEDLGTMLTTNNSENLPEKHTKANRSGCVVNCPEPPKIERSLLNHTGSIYFNFHFALTLKDKVLDTLNFIVG